MLEYKEIMLTGKAGAHMFGKGISCNDCVYYAGKLSDGKPMCMKRGPLNDIICCRRFHRQEEAPDGKKQRKDHFSDIAEEKCALCRYFKSEKEDCFFTSGECMKFPGKIFDGEKRAGCAFYKG